MATESGKKANVSAISAPLHLDHVLNDQIDPERILNWCTQLGDPDLTDSFVAAIQHNNFRRQSRPPLPDKRAAALCPHLHCSTVHSPDDCCLCQGQRHPIERFWHVIGLPENKQPTPASFKAQFASGSSPWAAKTVQALIHLPVDPNVLAIQTIDPSIKSPPLN
jgi:hypothetical protein